MKRMISLLLALSLCTSLVCTAMAEDAAADDAALADKIIEYFMPLTKIPRETYNEKQVSDYLLKWAQDRGYKAVQDSANNVVFDVPATAGRENDPLVGLQCHMDMVIAVDEGYAFDAKKDAIKVVRDGDKLSAEHTSLGADDGIGIAIALYMCENAPSHGPLRVIITTDEEKTQTGVGAIDPVTVADVKYLINIDYETSTDIVISSACGVNMEFKKTVTAEKATGDAAYEITVLGSAGGHSGLEINSGRVNAVVALCDLLYQLKYFGLDFAIASVSGGNAKNAIPVSAKAVIVADASKKDMIEGVLQSFTSLLRETYALNNPNINCVSRQLSAVPESVMSKADTDALICFGHNVVSGVYTMSQKDTTLVESSANLGVVKADQKEISFECFVRSSENAPKYHITGAAMDLAEVLGFAMKVKETSKSWPMKKDSVLTKKAAEIYKKQNGTDARVKAIHAGLECGAFIEMNPQLDVIAIGPDVLDAHTTKEHVIISSIPKTAKLIQGLLADLKN